MARIEDYELPDDLYYHKEHFWVRVEDKKAVVGFTDFAQKMAGEISFVELPEVDQDVQKDEVIGSIETGKWLGKIYAPLSGTITRVNEELEDEPTLINEDPYGRGWLFEMEITNPDELKELYKGEKAVEWLKEEIKKYKK